MPSPCLTSDQEKVLWDKRELSMDTSKGLSRAVIFYLIKAFALWQGRELRRLETSHVTFGKDDLGLFVAINLESIPLKNRRKVTKRYDDPANPRSVYKIFKKYRNYVANEGPFLVRPITSIKGFICYSPLPLGVNVTASTISTLMKDAGFDWSYYVNYSLNLQAIDILHRFGTGSHCLASWLLASGLKGMPPAPVCGPTNCEEANPEISLMISRLLDAPYPVDAVEIIQKIELEEVIRAAAAPKTDNSFSSWMSNLTSEDIGQKGPRKKRKNSDGDSNAKERSEKSNSGVLVHVNGRSKSIRVSKTDSTASHSKSRSSSLRNPDSFDNNLKISSVASISESAFDAQAIGNGDEDMNSSGVINRKRNDLHRSKMSPKSSREHRHSECSKSKTRTVVEVGNKKDKIDECDSNEKDGKVCNTKSDFSSSDSTNDKIACDVTDTLLIEVKREIVDEKINKGGNTEVHEDVFVSSTKDLDSTPSPSPVFSGEEGHSKGVAQSTDNSVASKASECETNLRTNKGCILENHSSLSISEKDSFGCSIMSEDENSPDKNEFTIDLSVPALSPPVETESEDVSCIDYSTQTLSPKSSSSSPVTKLVGFLDNTNKCTKSILNSFTSQSSSQAPTSSNVCNDSDSDSCNKSSFTRTHSLPIPQPQSPSHLSSISDNSSTAESNAITVPSSPQASLPSSSTQYVPSIKHKPETIVTHSIISPCIPSMTQIKACSTQGHDTCQSTFRSSDSNYPDSSSSSSSGQSDVSFKLILNGLLSPFIQPKSSQPLPKNVPPVVNLPLSPFSPSSSSSSSLCSPISSTTVAVSSPSSSTTVRTTQHNSASFSAKYDRSVDTIFRTLKVAQDPTGKNDPCEYNFADIPSQGLKQKQPSKDTSNNCLINSSCEQATASDKHVCIDLNSQGQSNVTTNHTNTKGRMTSDFNLGDYLPPGTVIPASCIQIITQEGDNGSEVIMKFGFNQRQSS